MNDGGKAFPSFERLTMLRRVDITPEQKETIYFESQGMSLRDYFAAKAMQGMCACSNTYDYTDTEGKTVAEYVADHAYFMADAMLAERNNHE